MSVYKDLLNLGVPKEHIDSHQSDLYVKRTKVVEDYLTTYEYKENVTTFIADDGEEWYEFPFAYDYKKEGDL